MRFDGSDELAVADRGGSRDLEDGLVTEKGRAFIVCLVGVKRREDCFGLRQGLFFARPKSVVRLAKLFTVSHLILAFPETFSLHGVHLISKERLRTGLGCLDNLTHSIVVYGGKLEL